MNSARTALQIPIVYKYASLGENGSSGAIEFFLEHRTLKFTSPSELNDLFEAVPRFSTTGPADQENIATEITKDYLRAHPEIGLVSEDEQALVLQKIVSSAAEWACAVEIHLERMKWRVAQEKFRRFGILSLSSSRDNLLMWAHYAGSAKGLCLGFNSSARVFSESSYEPTGLRGIQQVRYSTVRPTLEGITLEERLAETLLTKSIDWAYEKELRCFRELSDSETYSLQQFEPADLTEIIIGPNVSRAEIMRCLALSEQHFPDTSVYLAIPSSSEFRMRIVSCPPSRQIEMALRDFPEDISALGI